MSTQTVHILRLSHRYGDDFGAFSSYENAWKALEDYVREWWSEWIDDKPCPEVLSENDIEEYFEATQEGGGFGREEYYNIEECTIDAWLQREVESCPS
jgi:hypothetical protein